MMATLWLFFAFLWINGGGICIGWRRRSQPVSVMEFALIDAASSATMHPSIDHNLVNVGIAPGVGWQRRTQKRGSGRMIDGSP
jgi:hypothetical protein